MTQKKEYAAPALTRMGDFEELTQSTTVGTHLDQNYPAGTPLSQLLIS